MKMLWRVEMTTKDWEYGTDLADRAAARFEWINSNCESNSTVVTKLSDSIACYREIVLERKSQSTRQTSLLSCCKKLPRPPQPSAPTTLSSPVQPLHRGKTLHQQKGYDSLKAQMMVSLFRNEVFLIKVYINCFRHNALAHLIEQYSVNITSWTLGNQKIHLTCFIIILTLLWWSGTEPAISEIHLYLMVRMVLPVCSCET